MTKLFDANMSESLGAQDEGPLPVKIIVESRLTHTSCLRPACTGSTEPIRRCPHEDVIMRGFLHAKTNSDVTQVLFPSKTPVMKCTQLAKTQQIARKPGSRTAEGADVGLVDLVAFLTHGPVLRASIPCNDLMTVGRSKVVRIQTGAGSGTGFLIAPKLLLTALHVVATIDEGPEGQLVPVSETIGLYYGRFEGNPGVPGAPDEMIDMGDCEAFNRSEDWIVFRVKHERMQHVWHTRSATEADCGQQWATYGFNTQDGDEASGTLEAVDSPRTHRSRNGVIQISSLQLFSKQAAAGEGQPKHGYSGAPVVVRGHVVGLLVGRATGDKQEAKALGGTVYARPIQCILKGLGHHISETPSPLDQFIISPDPVYERVAVENFSGRKWILSAIDKFCSTHPHGYFIIEAAAGLGKTALAAHIAKTRNCCHHFLDVASGLSRQQRGARSLCAQLIKSFNLTSLESSAHELTIDDLPIVIRAASKNAGGNPILLIIDGLDECHGHETANAMGLPNDLPGGVYIFITQRPGPKIETCAPKNHILIKHDDAENLGDIKEYISLAVAKWTKNTNATHSQEDAAEILSSKSGGVWIYLHYLLKELETGMRHLADLGGLPDGIWNYYASFWSSQRTEDTDRWERVLLPLLGMLGAVQEPPTFEELCSRAGLTKTSELEETLQVKWGAFFIVNRESNSSRYIPYHASVTEFLKSTTPTNNLEMKWRFLCAELAKATKEAHNRLADRFLTAWGGWDQSLINLATPGARGADDQYGLRHCHAHLRNAGRFEESQRLLELSHEGVGNLWFAAHDDSECQLEFVQDHFTVVQSKDSFLSRFRSALTISSVRARAASVEPGLLPALVRSGLWGVGRARAHIDQIQDIALKVTSLMTLAHGITDHTLKVYLEDEAINTLRKGLSSLQPVILAFGIHVVHSMCTTDRALATSDLITHAAASADRLHGLALVRAFANLAPYLDEQSRATMATKLVSSWDPQTYHINRDLFLSMQWLESSLRDALFLKIIDKIDGISFPLIWGSALDVALPILTTSEQLLLIDRLFVGSVPGDYGPMLLCLHDDAVQPAWNIVKDVIESSYDEAPDESLISSAVCILLRMKPHVVEAKLGELSIRDAHLIEDRRRTLFWHWTSLPAQDTQGVRFAKLAALVPCEITRLTTTQLDNQVVLKLESLLRKAGRGEIPFDSDTLGLVFSLLSANHVRADFIQEILPDHLQVNDHDFGSVLIKTFSKPENGSEVVADFSRVMERVRGDCAEEDTTDAESSKGMLQEDRIFLAACRVAIWCPHEINEQLIFGDGRGTEWCNRDTFRSVAMLASCASSMSLQSAVWPAMFEHMRQLAGLDMGDGAVAMLLSCAAFIPRGRFVVLAIELLEELDIERRAAGEVLLALTPKVDQHIAPELFSAAFKSLNSECSLLAAASVVGKLPERDRQTAIHMILECVSEDLESWEAIASLGVLHRFISLKERVVRSLGEVTPPRGRHLAAAFAAMARLGPQHGRRRAWFDSLSLIGSDFEVIHGITPHVVASDTSSLPDIADALVNHISSVSRPQGAAGVLEFVPMLARWLSLEQFIQLRKPLCDVYRWWP